MERICAQLCTLEQILGGYADLNHAPPPPIFWVEQSQIFWLFFNFLLKCFQVPTPLGLLGLHAKQKLPKVKISPRGRSVIQPKAATNIF